WAADVTYIPMQHGFLYLVAIIDWATRRVLSWRLSNTLAAGFCVEALSEALARFGKPGIFNTDQGTQFTSTEFTKVLLDHGIEISMDGRGRCHDVSIRRGPRKDIPRGRPSGRHGTILSPALAGKGRGGALMRDLCCYAVILRRRWMTRRFAGSGSFEKRDHERPDNSPT